jgi:hypothetical protein
MRVPEKRSDDEALLSLDFIIGFTIFMVALIFVAVMISGLLVHLQSRTIDYDAVAYRTSVVLVEDPGEPTNWPQMNLTFPAERDSIKRMGLAVARNYPGILKMNKVEKFFDFNKSPGCLVKDDFCVPEDYQEKLIFGDYPYHFNISLKNLNTSQNYSVGAVPPEGNYGYMKRIVKIQKPGSEEYIDANPNGTRNTTTIRFNFYELYDRPAPYRIDPLNEEMVIFIQNFTSFPIKPNLTNIQICKYPLAGLPGCIGENAYDTSPDMIVRVDSDKPSTDQIDDNITVILEAGLFPRIGYDEFSSIDTILTFDRNVTNETLYYYNYSTITLPELESGVLEVKIW